MLLFDILKFRSLNLFIFIFRVETIISAFADPANEVSPATRARARRVFFIGVGYWGIRRKFDRVCLPPEIWKGKKEEKSESSQFHLHGDSVAPWKTQPSHHPSGTTSERTSSPEYREIGLAGFRAKEKPIPNEGDGSSVSVWKIFKQPLQARPLLCIRYGDDTPRSEPMLRVRRERRWRVRGL